MCTRLICIGSYVCEMLVQGIAIYGTVYPKLPPTDMTKVKELKLYFCVMSSVACLSNHNKLILISLATHDPLAT